VHLLHLSYCACTYCTCLIVRALITPVLLCVHLLHLSYCACTYYTCLILRALITPVLLCVHLLHLYSLFLLIGRVLIIPALTLLLLLLLLVVLLNVRVFIVLYRAVKSLARPGRKQAYVSVRMARISFGALPCRKKKNLLTARVSMLKSRASLTCFRACFLPGRAKDLSAPRYLYLHLLYLYFLYLYLFRCGLLLCIITF